MDIHALTEQLALNPLDPKDLLSAFGLPGVLAILFAETGLLVGFFFPGDSLLFLAGVAASEVANSIFGEGAQLSIVGLLIGAPVCAIVGAQLGHWLGARYGRRMFDKPESKLFKKEYVEKAEYYFEKFGPAKAVVLARFIPIVRTFLNPVAGTLGMPAKQFFLWNVVGAILWTDGIILIGYLLAEQIYAAIGDKIDRYILPVVVLIVLISVLPILIEILRERKAKKRGLKTADPATAIGVVAAASVVGLADAAREEYHEHFDHDQNQQGHHHQQGYGHQQDHGQQGYGQQHPQYQQPQYQDPQQPAYPQQGHYPTPQSYPPQQQYPPQPPQDYPRNY
ncbi:DedA family protein [Actinoplanes subglobosus]|uniref:DedA family protein n=1 Tax=Actinoplanes subglobosus TaxID=1547892 RepID=A0ABV8IR38_9ACTN